MTDRTTARAKTQKMSYPDQPHMNARLRLWGDLLLLWRLCDKPACSRARACKGDGRRCFPRNIHLTPQGVRDWFGALGCLQKEGVPFDDAMAELDASEYGAAFREWHAAVWTSLGIEEPLPARWWDAG